MVNRPNDGRVLIWPETDSCSKRATAEMNGTQTARIWIRKTKVEGTKRRSAMQAQINRAKSTTTVGLREGSKKISSAKFCGYTSGGKKSRVQRANNNLRKDFRLAQYTTSPDIAYYRWISTRSASCRQSVSRIAPRRSSMADMAILGRM